MGKAEESLEKLKKEKEELLKLSKTLAPEQRKGFSLKEVFKKKSFAPVKKEEKVVPVKEEKKVIEVKKDEPKKDVLKKTPELKKPEIKEGKKQEEKRFERKKAPKEKTPRRSFSEEKRLFSTFINKAGIDAEFDEINKKIIIACLISIVLATIFLIVNFIINKSFLMDALALLLSVWIFGGVAAFFLIWGGFFVYVDMRIYRRRKEVEAVFPDFLQLTAANINSGMPIDRALWYAIRPRFGILSNEMEQVAKATMVGENLNKALTDFSNKYDSLTIKRSLNLLLEGLDSGGEIGELLTRVANNIRDTEIMKKEMASSVTTYVIFILFATLGAAPFLFGLTTELIVIMSSIISQIQIGGGTQSFGGIGGMMASSGKSISLVDYQIFAITSICLSSIFAGIIISVIQKGDAKESFKQIPFYIAIGLTNYFVAFKILNWLLSGFFA